ncbi:hypothetical protein WT58_24050 [Burkholderia territorii]|uniref:hypothetical protein n=1 Tax=Burkholderia territorii TaxID=1503055 RepID=UPI00075C287F|nr:hypothetical protein [Burkholderia territorii]KWH03710.1 hypothetical protein WT58_24050 [Burkholderia territorii]
MITLLLALAWYLSGVGSFIFWWTRQHDFTTGEVILAGLLGLVGPIAFIMGAIVHADRVERVLIKRRK